MNYNEFIERLKQIVDRQGFELTIVTRRSITLVSDNFDFNVNTKINNLLEQFRGCTTQHTQLSNQKHRLDIFVNKEVDVN